MLEAYTKGKGNMNYMYEVVMLSEVLKDDVRFRAIIDEAIAKKEVEAYDKYTKESQKSKDQRMKRAEKEAAEAREMSDEEEQKGEGETHKGKKGGKASKTGDGGMDSLVAAIQQKNKAKGENFLDRVIEKYSKPSKSGNKKKRVMEEPTEEEFAAAAARSKKGKGRK